MELERSFLEEFCYSLPNYKISMKAKISKEIVRLNNELYGDNILVKVVDRNNEAIMLLIYKQSKIIEVLKVEEKSDTWISIKNKYKELVNELYVYEISKWLYKYIKKLEN
ncbi:MAG: hypothetical protein HFJ29_00960 [Clostridia bacterium]|nr:hypothetical protein [Clostridia bacterium]